MATDGRKEIVLDTSVLVNFLTVDRVDLLSAHPALRFVVTDHVRGEITLYYPEEVERLNRAVSASAFTISSLDSLDSTFVALIQEGRLGIGECAAIALAVRLGAALAVDDKRAARTAVRACPALGIETTESIMISLIKAGILDVKAADAIKQTWEISFRFKLMFASFADRI